MKVILPWPPRELSPNARVHWAKLAKAKRAYRHQCWALARAANLPHLPADAQPTLTLDFFPPTAARRDLDNCLSAVKAGLDGLADALNCDDSRWRLEIRMAGRGGRVEVTIR